MNQSTGKSFAKNKKFWKKLEGQFFKRFCAIRRAVCGRLLQSAKDRMSKNFQTIRNHLFLYRSSVIKDNNFIFATKTVASQFINEVGLIKESNEIE